MPKPPANSEFRTDPPATPAGEPLQPEPARLSEHRRPIFFKLVEQLSAARTRLEAARFIAAAADRLFAMDAFALNSYFDAEHQVHSVLSIDVINGRRVECLSGNQGHSPSPIATQVIHEGAKLILREGNEPAAGPIIAFGDKSRRSASLMFAPIRCGSRVIGILSVQSYQPRAYRPEDLETLQALADLSAGAKERIRAEEALRESESRLAQAQRLAGMGSFERDLLTGKALWSSEHYELWGRDPELGPPNLDELYAGVHPDDREQVRLEFDRQLAGGESFDQQYRIVRPDGTVRHVITRIRVERDDCGQPVRIMGTAQDITGRKQTEEALRESEARHALIYNTVNDSMWLIDVEPGERYIFRSINDAFERVTGLTRAQVLDRPMEEWFPPASLGLVRSKYREAVATGRPLEYLETTVLPAGQRVGEITIIPILNAEGKCTQLLGKAHDVTEARKNAAAMQAIEDRYRLLADNTDDFVSLIGPKGERLYVSPSFYRATGWTPEEINRTDWRTRVHPEDLPQVEAAHAANVAGRQTTSEVRIRCRDGSWIWVELKCKPLLDSDGRVQSLLNCSRDITARKRGEEEIRQLNESLEQRVRERTGELEKANQSLHESEQRFRRIVQTAEEGIWTIDAEARTDFVNPKMAQMLGYTVEEMRGRALDDFMDTEGRAISAKNLERRQQGIAEQHEFKFRRKDGSKLWTLIATNPITNANGAYIGALAMVTDITARKLTEAALQESEERFRAIFEQAAVGVGVLDTATGRFIRVNQRYSQIMGMTPEQMMATTFMQITHPDDLSADLQRMELMKQDVIKSFSIDKRLLRPNGSIVWVNLTVSPMWSQGEAPTFHIAVVEDITRRKRAEEKIREFSETLEQRVRDRTAQLEKANAALSESEEQRERFFRLSLDLLCFANLNGSFTKVNPAFTQLLGYSETELLSRPLIEFVHPDDRQATEREFTKLGRGENVSGFENRYVCKDGSTRTLSWSCPPPPPGSKEIFTLARDVTEHRQLQREILEISDRERDRIGQDLHDGLCQELIGIAFAANQLVKKLKQQSLPESAEAGGIAALLDDSITLARQLARGLYPVGLEAGALPTALHDLANQIRQRFRIDCSVEADDTIQVEDPGQATHLFRIAQEAVNNAAKHSQASRIILRLQRKAGGLQISVIDDGIGLSSSDRTTSGMGLHILSYRATAIGGLLEIAAAPGGGTTVSCTLSKPTTP